MTTAEHGCGPSRRVLVIEDSDDIRMLLRMWLETDPRCATVAEATSVADALSAAQVGDYDAVVLDFMLGDGTAADCLPHLRKAWPDAHIVVYTACVRVAREAGLMDLGADLLVEKVSVVVEDVIDLVLSARREALAVNCA